MTDFNQRQDGKPSQNDRSSLDIELELDAGLARYAAVEPRPGLDERILTNLRAQKVHAATHGWWKWKWTALATLAAILLVALTLFWSGERRQNNVTRHRSLIRRLQKTAEADFWSHIQPRTRNPRCISIKRRPSRLPAPGWISFPRPAP